MLRDNTRALGRPPTLYLCAYYAATGLKYNPDSAQEHGKGEVLGLGMEEVRQCGEWGKCVSAGSGGKCVSAGNEESVSVL